MSKSLAGSAIFCFGIGIGCAMAGFIFCCARFGADKCGGKEAMGEYKKSHNRIMLVAIWVLSILLM